jgi:glycosyltransferase involved in cell wall biosynthesis
MKVTISSARADHSYKTALAMQKAGVLDKYYTEFYFKPDSLSGSLLISLSNSFRLAKNVAARLYSNRHMEGLKPQNVVSIPTPEFLGRVWRYIPILRKLVAGNKISDNLFDLLVSRQIKDCDIFHGWLGYSLNTMKKLRGNGTKVLIDIYSAHPYYWKELIEAEYRRFNLDPTLCDHPLREKYLEEIEKADFLVAPSQYVYHTCVREDVPEEKIKIIPFGVDPERFKPIKKSDDVFRLLYVGAISVNKGVYYLLEVFKQLSLPNSELVLIGHLQPELEGSITGYNGLFKHFSHIPNNELYRWYGNSSVFVFPSLSEGSALVTYEAMACGLPSIVSENSGSVVRNKLDGFVIPIRDIESLREKILFFYENEDKRKEMGESARKYIENFTWEKYGEKLIEFYKEVYNDGGLTKKPTFTNLTRKV